MTASGGHDGPERRKGGPRGRPGGRRATDNRPRIVVEFAGPDSATMIVRPEGVTAGQLYAAAWLLDRTATEHRTDAKLAGILQAQQMAALAGGLRNGGKG